MGYAELIATLRKLPAEKQAEVFDFVEFLALRFGEAKDKPTIPDEWSDAEFAEFAMAQALRGMEDEPVLYTRDDLKEHWVGCARIAPELGFARPRAEGATEVARRQGSAEASRTSGPTQRRTGAQPHPTVAGRCRAAACTIRLRHVWPAAG